MCPTMDDFARELRKIADAEALKRADANALKVADANARKAAVQYLAELRPKLDEIDNLPSSKSDSSFNTPDSTIISPQPTRAAYLSRSTSSPNALSSPKTSPTPAATIPQSPTPKTPSLFKVMSVF